MVWTRLTALFITLSIHTASAFGPLNGSLDLGTSTSGSYQARNIFINPAALGFETALNGFESSASFAIGSNSGMSDDLAFAFAFGNFGFGAEQLPTLGMTRYQFGVGLPLSSSWFFGARLALERYTGGLRKNVWDLGFQYRPHRNVAFGLVFEQATESLYYTTLSTTLRPLRFLDLTFDATTRSTAFAKDFAFQGMVNAEVAEGVKLRAGYHTDYQWLVGLQVHLGVASFFTSVQPSMSQRRFVAGFQSGTVPYSTVIAPPKNARITVSSNLSEEKSSGSFLSPAHPSLLDLIEDIDELATDPSVDGLLLQIEAFPLGLASAHEVHLALRRLRRAGKTVEIYLGNVGMKEYLIATAADKIYMEPAGEIRWLGVRSERYFLKGTLDKIGLEGEFLAAGKYKSAPETFTRKEGSEASKLAAQEEMKSLEETLAKLFHQARGIDAAKSKRLMELGLLSSDEALKEGLIDGTASYASVLATRERKDMILPVMHRRRNNLALPPRIAVIVANGNIMPNRIRWLALSGNDQLTPGSMEKKFRQVQNDSRTEALVLRVSSPGGEVLASQQIASRLEELKTKKPLYISMGDVAASGGYYIAAPGMRIFAGPMTITGSIGVFLGKFNASGLFRFLDLHKEILSQGPYPGLYSEDRPWTKAERAVMERRLNNYYDSFIGYVATQRAKSRALVAEAAQGRVWTGAQALSNQLVDELGGYTEVVKYIAETRGLEPNDFELWQIEAGGSLLDMLENDAFALSRNASPFSVLPQEMRGLLWMTTLKESPFLYLAPVSAPDA